MRRFEEQYLRVTVQQPHRLIRDLQQHLLGPDLVFGVQEDQLLDGIIHSGDGLRLVHHKGGEMLRGMCYNVTDTLEPEAKG